MGQRQFFPVGETPARSGAPLSLAHVRLGRPSLSLLATLAFAGAALYSMACGADALPEAGREPQLRAAYFFNFARFVQWPSIGAKDPITFCFIGGAKILEAFSARTSGKQLDAHPIVARALQSANSAAGCQMLYVESAARPSIIFAARVALPMLTVGDQNDFLQQGGIIELFTENNRLRFNVNLANGHRAGLVISSNLLQLAKNVEQAAP